MILDEHGKDVTPKPMMSTKPTVLKGVHMSGMEPGSPYSEVRGTASHSLSPSAVTSCHSLPREELVQPCVVFALQMTADGTMNDRSSSQTFSQSNYFSESTDSSPKSEAYEASERIEGDASEGARTDGEDEKGRDSKPRHLSLAEV